MSTALDLIKDAMTEIGVLAAGATPASADQTWGLRKLNELIDHWNARRLRLYSVHTETVAVTAPAQFLTIGPEAEEDGPDLEYTHRPTEIIEANWTDAADFRIPLGIITMQEYSGIPNPTFQGATPARLAYNPTYPYGTVYLFPVPTATTCSLELTYHAHLAEFATTGTPYSLPPGYKKAIVMNLALALCPSFSVQPNRILVAGAQETLTDIASLNIKKRRLITDVPTMHGTMSGFSSGMIWDPATRGWR